MEDGTVLVTGATGLLGTWLLKRAPRPASVVAVTHRQAIIGIESVAVDLRDSASTLAMVANVRPSLILHAAYAKDSASNC